MTRKVIGLGDSGRLHLLEKSASTFIQSSSAPSNTLLELKMKMLLAEELYERK